MLEAKCPKCGHGLIIRAVPSQKHQPRIISWDCTNLSCDQNPKGRLGRVADKIVNKISDLIEKRFFKESKACQKDQKSDV